MQRYTANAKSNGDDTIDTLRHPFPSAELCEAFNAFGVSYLKFNLSTYLLSR